MPETDACVDAQYRSNLTLASIAQDIEEQVRGGNHQNNELHPLYAIERSTSFILGTKANDGMDMTEHLHNKYFLVGVSEKVDEFLVLLALANGWDLDSIHYKNCQPSDLEVSSERLNQFFPSAVDKLKNHPQVKRAQQAYEQAKRDFEEHVQGLGSWFTDKVEEFSQQQRQKHSNPRKWKKHQYMDGFQEEC